MAQASRQSPYTIGPPADGITPDSALVTDARYAVPGPDDAEHDGWWDATGFATSLRISPTDTPDATRLGVLPMYETREGAGDPLKFNERYRGEGNDRHTSQEDIDSDGFETQVQFKHYVPRPVPSDVVNERPTSRMSPRSYTFLRPFGRQSARHLNGEHFSMADHRRDYPIHGMAPNKKYGRNTFRLDPAPWDTDIVDLPPDVNSSPDARIRVVDIPPADNRSWRL